MNIEQQILLNTTQTVASTPTVASGAVPTIYEGRTQLAVTENKRGTKTALLSAKAWKLANADSLKGLSNRQVKSEYQRYLLNGLDASTAGLQAIAASGRWGVKSAVVSTDGNKMTVSLVNKASVKGLALAEAEKSLENLDAAQLAAIYAKLAEMVSKS